MHLFRRGTSSLFNSSNVSLASSKSDATTDAVGDNGLAQEGFKSVPDSDKLFVKPDPAVDGEDCLHDCATCTVKYPAKFDVDLEDKLYGQVSGWSTHMLVATGKSDWVRDVADETGSVMEAIEKGGIEPSNGVSRNPPFPPPKTESEAHLAFSQRLKLSASNMPVPDEYHMHEAGKQPTNVLILPSFTVVENVTPQLAPDLIERFVNRSLTTTTPLGGQPEPSKPTEAEEKSPHPANTSITPPLQSHPCLHAAVILLCSQRTRDARCGQSAPLLRREFERHLRPLGLYRDMDDTRPGGVGIYFISHVGGHKYSANVIVYRRRDFEWYKREEAETNDEGATQGIWLARVRPEECENIIRYTVLQGKVLKPQQQLRGGFDRERGLTSW
ncbi:Sucrase/ferredoxin-like family protein [Penicillium maclennaniae]|uniref:Sucrase/ferredoxin-like family protein n=1 Tax=Penicillium maclennaniae TaxID=1343394 RepID=UPI00254179FD|nr:Sucrase/ferredoxin-like family protein [Penicillium maclennaniae]KAJ5665903.1 Sucrase/ferredoxin-like family protein [Penicillium maclennaniae]